MKNRYDILLTAGSRINGFPKFGSNAERISHEQHLNELKTELGSAVISYHDNLGFLTVELTDEEYLRYQSDCRIYDISKSPEYVPRTAFTKRDTAVNDQWHLRLLSDSLFSPVRRLSGFELDYNYTRYGVFPVDYCDVSQSLRINTVQNKIFFREDLYEYELNQAGTVITLNSSVANFMLPLDVDLYIVFDVSTQLLNLVQTVSDTQAILYTVKVGVYMNSTVVYWSGTTAGLLGFYDLKLLETTADVYRTTVNGEGVEVIIADTQLDYTEGDFGGRAHIAYNAYAAVYNTEYGAWDSVTALIDRHGTACGLAAGGTISGLANKVKITGVTCLDISEDRGNVSNSTLDGLNFIVGYIHGKKLAAGNKPYPVVVNVSFGSSTVSAATDAAIASIINEGALVCIAAGNDNLLSNNSPYDPNALFVAACDRDLIPCDFTHYGPRIDLYAPGKDIYSTLVGTYHRWDGTSVASPNVAGLCAIYLSMFPSATPAEVKTAIMNTALAGITYNKDYTTYLVTQHPFYAHVDRQSLNTATLNPDLIYTAVPYAVGYDGERVYGSMQELTLNKVTSAVVSAGQSESIDLATSIRLVP